MALNVLNPSTNPVYHAFIILLFTETKCAMK